MTSKPSMLGIVLPTRNRPDFLLRQLSYYVEMGSRHTIYIGDSSEPGCFKQVTETVGRLQNYINIVHLKLPGLNATEATTELLHSVQEPYAAIIGDDDFLVPHALERCAKFLDTHPDFSTAHGVATLCHVEAASTGGHLLKSAGEYSQRSLEHSSASERLTQYLGNYFVTHYSVHRTRDFSKDMDATNKIPDAGFGELVSGCLSVIGGKAKQFDDLGLVRQIHQRRNLLPDVYEWVTKEDWLPSYRAFHNCLAEAVARQDAIAMEEAQETVKKAFWAYLARTFSAKWQSRYRSRDSGLAGRVRRVGRAVPGARNVWRQLARFRALGFSPEDNMLSLPALLRPSSPYHADFIRIYRVITAPHVNLTDAGARSMRT